MKSKWDCEFDSKQLNEFRCTGGKCAPDIHLSWKELLQTVRRKTFTSQSINGNILTCLTYRWSLLLMINPFRWKSTIYAWAFEDKIVDKLSEQIRKEIDDSIIADILASMSNNVLNENGMNWGTSNLSTTEQK